MPASHPSTDSSTPRAAAVPGAVRFRPALDSDAEGIRRLLRATPFGGRISLTLECDPDHRDRVFGFPGSRSQVVVATRESAPHEILGLAERAGHRLWVDGEGASIGYLAQLRRLPGEEITLRRLRDGYALLEGHRRDDELPFDYTAILAQNAPARRLLERGLPGLPRYTEVGRMATLTFAASPSRTAKVPAREVSELQDGDREGVLDCLRRNLQRRQLAPDLGISIFDLPGTRWLVSRRGGEVDGCVALWDQRAFKAVTIHGYAPWLRRLRAPLNLWRTLRGLPALPPVGGRLPLAFLAFLAADCDDCGVMASLVSAGCSLARAQSLSYLSLGLPVGHPCLTLFEKWLRPDTIESVIYLAHPAAAGRAADPPAAISPALPVFPEVALL